MLIRMPLRHAIAACALIAAGALASAEAMPGNYEAEIAQLETQGGALDPRLVEPLLGLALQYRDTGRYRDAEVLLRRALHVRRVNEGLHRIEHRDLVELLIGIGQMLEDWESLDRDFQFLYWLHRRNYGDDVRVVDVIERIADARLDAYRLAPGGRSLAHLVRADALCDDALAILKPRAEEHAARLIAMSYRSAVANYHLAEDFLDFKVSWREIRESLIETGRGTPMEVDEKQAREVLFRDSFAKGEVAIRRVVKLTGRDVDRAPLAHAEALVFMGDWYLLFRRKIDAMQRYRRAWQVLREHDVPAADIAAIFGEPKPLQTLTPPGPAEPGIVPERPWVEAVIDVPDSGWPANIRIRTVHPENEQRLQTRGYYAIAALRYRPRFANGEPVATEDVPLRYLFSR
jgi:tetratricopeptide (TPR) repeat protein